MVNDLIEDGECFNLHHGDCITHMAEMPEASVDFSVFSPPFPSLFSYTEKESDLGNSEDLLGEAKLHFGFFFRQLRRVMKPGRIIVLHLMQIPGLARNGQKGTFDFRGLVIRLAKQAGFIYQYDWLVAKNPQAQAIRTHSHKLLFVSLERDRAVSCGAFGDYLIKLITPGENKVSIDSANEITRTDWINWAEACWDDIIETDTLNVAEGRGKNDTKHICPLQLETIRRLVLLYTNPGEIVFTPFAGIGSEMFVSLGGESPKTKRRIFQPRRAYGCELKDEYYHAAINNCERAMRDYRQNKEQNLFKQEQMQMDFEDAS